MKHKEKNNKKNETERPNIKDRLLTTLFTSLDKRTWSKAVKSGPACYKHSHACCHTRHYIQEH